MQRTGDSVLVYAEVTVPGATQNNLSLSKQERQGAPQTTDEGVFLYDEFVGEEQRSISMLNEAQI